MLRVLRLQLINVINDGSSICLFFTRVIVWLRNSIQKLQLMYRTMMPLSSCLSRSVPTGRLPIAPICWRTAAAWLCWWLASSWSPPCWSWRWLRTAAWPDTSSWACASSHTAGPCTRTCPPPSTAAWAPAAAAAGVELAVAERERSGCEVKVGEKGKREQLGGGETDQGGDVNVYEMTR